MSFLGLVGALGIIITLHRHSLNQGCCISFSPAFQFLDHYGGPQRWDVCYNMVVLRSISYGIDVHNAATPQDKEKKVRGAVFFPCS